MKSATVSILLLGVLGIGFLAGSVYNRREGVSAAGLGGRTVLYYVDPMHPAYKSDKPGIAPDCGMQLEPVYDDARHHGASHAPAAALAPGTVNVSPDQQQVMGVRVSTVERTSGTQTLRLSGRVAADETRLYKIKVGIDGFIRDSSEATTGSYVRKDAWLATFSAPEARTRIQAYVGTLDVLERAKGADSPAAVDIATAALQQGADRLVALGMSPVQIEEINRTRQVPSNIRITAPHEGFVVSRNLSVGEKVGMGDELYRIADLRRVWILADVFGREAEYVRPAAVAHVSLPGRSRSFRATVSSAVLPQFDLATQSIKVRLEADNPDYLLRPDMFVDVDLEIALPPAIVVPADSVIDTGLKKTVFVERSPGVFEPRTVETGWRFGDRVQILNGLENGERIAVSGTFLLDSETRMRHVTPQSPRGHDRPHH